MLIDTGKVDLNIRDEFRETPLLKAIRLGHEKIAEMLIDTGKVDLTCEDINNQILLAAVTSGSEKITKMLIDTGKVDLNINGMFGATPLIKAIRLGHEKIAKMLIDTGKVDLNIKDRFGETPLLTAINLGKKDLAKLLLDNRVEFNLKDIQLASSNGMNDIAETMLAERAEKFAEYMKKNFVPMFSSNPALPSNDCAPEDLDCAGKMADSAEI